MWGTIPAQETLQIATKGGQREYKAAFPGYGETVPCRKVQWEEQC